MRLLFRVHGGYNPSRFKDNLAPQNDYLYNKNRKASAFTRKP
jgi:hypothetical protein